jgi:putative flavoprotein involved in K+ transport
MERNVESVIIGGGQAGLAVSYYLTQFDQQHIVFEQETAPASAWRNRRWDSFTLNTPNWQSVLPGADIPGKDPDGFLGREEIVAYLEDYIRRFQLPVRYGVRVLSVDPSKSEAGYLVQTNVGKFRAREVVVATGLHQVPKFPIFSRYFPPSIVQIHSDYYRNPESLPAGSVLVVGSAQTGAQIAAELNQAGRKVYLSTSSAGRVPRSYRGKDSNRWQLEMGAYERTVDQLPSPKAKFGGTPRHWGKEGRLRVNLHQFARDGMVLLGRAQGVHGHRLLLSQDLKQNLAKEDKFEADFVQRVDEFIATNNIHAPIERLPELRDGYDAADPSELNLRASKITTVIWATGYKFDFSLVRFSVLDSDGYPIQTHGVTTVPGVYFVGLPWLHKAKSGLLSGLEEDAAHIATTIVERRKVAAGLVRRSSGSNRQPSSKAKAPLLTRGTTGIGAGRSNYLLEEDAGVVLIHRGAQLRKSSRR